MLPELQYIKALLKRKEDLEKRLHNPRIMKLQRDNISSEILIVENKISKLKRLLEPFIEQVSDKEMAIFIKSYFLENKNIDLSELDAHSYSAPRTLYRETMRFLKSQ